MEEKEKLVGEEALNKYNHLIKQWFTGKVDAIEFIEPVYHEDSRILEFVKTTYGASGN